MLQEQSKDTTIVTSDCETVACSGTEDVSGHPKIFLNFGTNDTITCPYCSKKFIKKEDKDSHL